MEILKRVIQQTSWQVLGKAVTSISSLVSLGIITRSYGETGTGVFTLALAYLNFFFFASDLGFNAHLLPRLEQQKGLVFRKLLGLRLVWSLVLMFLALALLPFYPFSKTGFPASVVLASPAIILSSFFITTSLIFQKHLKYNLSSISLGVGAIWAVFMVWLISFLKLPVYYLTLAHLLDWALAAFLAVIFVRRLTRDILPIFDFAFSKKLISEVWLLSLTFTTSLIYFRVDTFILSSFKPLSEVGVYNLAYTLFQSALLGSTFIINSYYPLMLKAFDQGKKIFFRQILKASLLMGSLALAGSIFTVFSSEYFIKLLAGSSGFSGSATSLRILALSFPGFFISTILMWTLITLKRYQALIVIYFSGLIFNFLANVYFIPQYSYIASSWVTVVSEYLILSLQIITLFL